MKKIYMLIICSIFLYTLPLFSQEFLLGTWFTEEEWDGELVKDFFTFNQDGTGTWYIEGEKGADTFTYTIDEKAITMVWIGSGNTTIYNYTFNKDGTLTLGIDFGYGDGYQEWIYRRFN